MLKLNKVGDVAHQGDVFITKIAKALNVKEELKATDKGIILQHGEALGHYHKIKPTDAEKVKASLVSLTDTIRVMQLQVLQEVTVEHEEHNAITLTPGFYQINTQRESFQGMTRRIVD